MFVHAQEHWVTAEILMDEAEQVRVRAMESGQLPAAMIAVRAGAVLAAMTRGDLTKRREQYWCLSSCRVIAWSHEPHREFDHARRISRFAHYWSRAQWRRSPDI
jgi:hypothetical protein